MYCIVVLLTVVVACKMYSPCQCMCGVCTVKPPIKETLFNNYIRGRRLPFLKVENYIEVQLSLIQRAASNTKIIGSHRATLAVNIFGGKRIA